MHTLWTGAAGDKYTFYKNGAAAAGNYPAPATFSLHDSYTIGRVGCANDDIGCFDQQPTTGTIDQVEFYDYVMSPADVWNKYAAENSGDATGAACGSGSPGTAQLSIIVDNSHTTWCNGELMGSASSWNTPDTWECTSTDGNYVVAVDGVDGELAVGSGFGGFMATLTTDDGRVLNSDTSWKCWVDSAQLGEVGHGSSDPPDGWNQIDFDDSSWATATSFGFNTDPTTHWYPYIRPNGVDDLGSGRGGNRNGLAAGEQDKSCDDCVGAVGGGIADESQWIWTVELDAHNDVFCRGVLDSSDMAATAIDVNDFDTRGSNAKVVGDVLQVTQVAGGQRGEAYTQLPAMNLNEPVRLSFDMYIGDGSGADGMCANIGNDDLGNRVGENGVTQGFAFCFDEWSNGSTESGIKIFYNAGPDSGGDGHGCPAMSAGTDATGTVALMDDCHVYTDVADCGGGFCGDKSPVSVFNDATWHTVTIDISQIGRAHV